MSEPSARPYIGGQAVIEGVMMRSPGSYAVVCRKRSGELVVREKPMSTVAKGPRTWPFFRGVLGVVDALRLGFRALEWSASVHEQDLEEEDEGAGPTKGSSIASVLALSAVPLAALPDDADPRQPPPDDEESSLSPIFKVVMILIVIGLFIAAPQAGAEGINKLFGLGLPVTSAGFQAITGAMKLMILVGYLALLRRGAMTRRTFQYHGAEHKTISTYEAGEELSVVNARKKSTRHARCGTTFIIMVALVSVVVFSIVGALLPQVDWPRPVQSAAFFALKLPLIPVIAAVTFELQRLFARYCTTGPLRILLMPGFLVQGITTIEPDDAQLEVALASLRATLWREQAIASPEREDRVFESYPALAADPGYA